jgi:hypothetical protein
MSSVELLCCYAESVYSRGYKLAGRGCRAQIPMGVSNDRFLNPCDSSPPLPLIDARVRGQKGEYKFVLQCYGVGRSFPPLMSARRH